MATVDSSKELSENSSDASLVKRAARGDRSAVAVLYARHARALLTLARGMLQTPEEAEDLIHDVFIEAWRRSAEYSEERGTVRAWLFMRARSRALDRLKSAGRRRDAMSRAEPREASGTANSRWMLELLARMPECQQEVLVLGYFEGLTTVEIAKRLHIPAGTVKSRTRAALASLRDVLGSRDD